MKTLGYSLNEIDEMGIGFMQDILLEKMNDSNRAKKKKSEPKKVRVRDATQRDMDRLAGLL